MNIAAYSDPAEIVNARASAEDWPVQCSSRLVFHHDELNTLASVWKERAGERFAPYRSELDARALKPVLRHVAISERIYENGIARHRMRLVGSSLAQRFGDSTGRFLDKTVPPHLLARWTTIYDAVLDTCRPMRAVVAFDLPHVSHLIGEVFLAPMRNAEGEPNLVLTANCFRSKLSGLPETSALRVTVS